MRAGLAVTLLLVVLQVVAGDAGPLARLEALTLDARFHLRGAQPVSGEVVVLMADDAAVEAAGRWPWPRRRLAELVDRLRLAGAGPIVLDLLFVEPDPDPGGDAALAAAMARSGAVVLPIYVDTGAGLGAGTEGGTGGAAADGTDPDSLAAVRASAFPDVDLGREQLAALPGAARVVVPVPRLARAAAAVGHANLFPDADGQARHEALAVRGGDAVYPALSLVTARLRLGIPHDAMRLVPGLGVDLGGQPVATDGALRLPVNHLGPAGTVETISLADLWQGAVVPERLRGRTVLVGAAVTGLADRLASPFGEALWGVERHAAVVESLLTNRLLRRDAVTRLADLGVTALAGAAAGALALLPPAAALTALGALAFAVAAAVHLAFVAGGLILTATFPLAAVVVGGAAVLSGTLIRTRREQRRIRDAFAQYLHPALVERLARHPGELRLGGELRTLTVLFADVRGFTGLSERLAPEALVGLMGDYLEAMAAEVLRHGGYVDKYMGDGIMAIFGAPVAGPQPELDACRCALAMQRAAAAGRERWRRWGVEELRIGVGIHTGPMVIGNVGGAGRLNYTVVGDSVNIGARLEAATKSLGVAVVISDDTHRRVGDRLPARPLGAIALAGRTAAVEAWELVVEADALAGDAPRQPAARRRSGTA
ncbi:CHASE2 domain-containing protein [Azospirillum sp. ST 5-10]|uniref:CHASE2 domain-containing protein n=1 Tax=unclassified Azospirillum TaxID=2630922 RepID=UPI003F49F74B